MSDRSDGLLVSGINALPAELAILDSEGTIVLVNEAWRKFSDENQGVHQDYWVGGNYLRITEQADDEAPAKAVVEGLKSILDGTKEQVRVEYPCHSPDEQRWFMMHAAGFTHDGERHILVTHHNISDRKLTEMQSDAQAEQLETLLGVLTHDIRNPLNVIEGYTEMLAADLDEAEEVDKIRQAANRVTEISEATLEFTKSGTLTEVEQLSLHEVAGDAWTNVETAEATLAVTDSKRLLGDRRLLLQLFENLYRNAIEHAGSTCAVSAGPLETGFYVEDDGEGIPEAVREKVLKRDFSSRETGGLGLTIVQSIASAHDADLTITESADGGARFEITDMDVASDPPDSVPGFD